MNSRTKKGEPLAFLRMALTYDGDECLTWPYAQSEGYGQVAIDGQAQSVCRLICSARIGPPPTPKHEVAHSCGRGHLRCCAGSHLSWKTRKQNHADKLIHGTHNRGTRHSMVKLDERDVHEIRGLRGRETGMSLARRFNVTPTTIGDIQSRRTWFWLGDAS